jgi:hypothetical protein
MEVITPEMLLAMPLFDFAAPIDRGLARST